jgi:hypothetical protein
MTYIEAAIDILKQNGNQPMKSREIWDEILFFRQTKQ